MAWFYGWSVEYVESLPMIIAKDYYEAITIIDAQDKLILMQIADYPKMKRDSRQKLFKEIKDLANPQHLQKPMDFEEFIRKMSNG